MRINTLNNINIKPLFGIKRGNQNAPVAKIPVLSSDVVSFKAKNYSADTILNPTNHCAYCGAKVYNEQQIDSLTKEILSSKNDKLSGKVKSIVEKLEIAKYSQELSIAKTIQNEKEIKFFNDLISLTGNTPYLRCETVLDNVYGYNSEESYELISKNLKPLQKTIDHISPQNLNQDNNSSDMNLVESCYCCNHDLKQGMPFQEFYAMFPSIKKNMPPEKFQWAATHLLDSSQDSILKRMSAVSVLNLLNRLNYQRNETQSELNSIDMRIKSCNDSISSAIEYTTQEIDEKKAKITEMEEQLSAYKNDDEFQALLKRLEYQTDLDNVETVITKLSDKKQRISSALAALEKGDKKKDMLKPKDREERIDTYKKIISSTTSQLREQHSEKTRLEEEITKIDEQYPPYDVIQQQKYKGDRIVNAHNSLAANNIQISEKENLITDLQDELERTKAEIAAIPLSDKKYDEYSQEERAEHTKYIQIKDALQTISNSSNGNTGSTKAIIYEAAQIQLEKDKEFLETKPIVINFNNEEKRKELLSSKSKIERNISEAQRQLSDLQRQNASYSTIAAEMSKEEAEKLSETSAAHLRSLNDKMNHIKIPSLIEKTKSEISLLNSTIQSLLEKQKEIMAMYGAQA